MLALALAWSLTPMGIKIFFSQPALALTPASGTPAVVMTEIADQPQEWAHGLMDRWRLDADVGMLFIYPDQRPLSFWMKNTPISLDIIFIDADGTIKHIHERAQPLSEDHIPSRAPVRFVLEVNGGMAAEWGLKPGDKVIPSPMAALFIP